MTLMIDTKSLSNRQYYLAQRRKDAKKETESKITDLNATRYEQDLIKNPGVALKDFLRAHSYGMKNTNP